MRTRLKAETTYRAPLNADYDLRLSARHLPRAATSGLAACSRRLWTLAMMLTIGAAWACESSGGPEATAVESATKSAEELAQEILEEYGQRHESGWTISGDANVAYTLNMFGIPTTVEDIERMGSDEARRMERELSRDWTRDYLKRLAGPNPPPSSEYLYGPTLADEIASMEEQLAHQEHSIEHDRLAHLSPEERLTAHRAYLTKLRGPDPSSYPYLYGQPTLEDEIAWVAIVVKGLEHQATSPTSSREESSDAK